MNDIRPIDANALFDALYDNEFQTLCPLDEVSDVIAAAPTLDYAPVRHGEWLGCENYNDIVQCSSCGLIRNIYKQEGWNYCPNCGAKMDGGKKDENA